MNGDKSAFPVIRCLDGNWVKDTPPEAMGLTKRELFAAMAMQGFCSCPESQYDNVFTFFNCATDAVNMADALIKELEKPCS